MRRKLNPKKRALLIHKLVVLCDLLIDNLDELKPNADMPDEMQEAAEVLKKQCETLIEDVFEISEVKSSTYLQEIAIKVDTVIRKNYKPMKS